MHAHPAALSALLSLLAPLTGQQQSESPEALEKRARAIHARVLTLDTHKDISANLAPEKLPDDPAEAARMRQRFDPAERGDQQVDFPKMREGHLDCAFFIVYVGQGRNDGAGFVRAKQQAMLKFDAIHRMARLYPGHIGLATTADQVEQLHQDGKLIACIGIENGYCMGEDLSLVEEFHRRGARYMSIAHNRHSQLGDSHTPKEPLHNGLSELGRKAVAEMNRVGIMVDISHASKDAMMQAVELSSAPVIASHSGAAAVNAHSRNLDDEQLRALAANGGVIQCVALASFVKSNQERDLKSRELRAELGIQRRGNRGEQDADCESRMQQYRDGMVAINAEYPRANVQNFVDHIEHAVKVAGIDHVGISSDFDGGGGIDGWNDASETANVTLELVRRGYTEEQIQQLWSGNLLRAWREVEAKAQQLQSGSR